MASIESEYRRLRRNIQRTIKSAEKRGFNVPKSILPKIPKKITEGSVRRLLKIVENKYRVLYEKSTYRTESGEEVSGRKGQVIKRKEASEKAKTTRERNKQTRRVVKKTEEQPKHKYIPPEEYEPDIMEEVLSDDETVDAILEGYYFKISGFNADANQILSNWLDTARSLHGDKAVASALQLATENGITLDAREAYNKKLVIAYLESLADYIPEIGQFEKETLYDAIESEEIWTDFNQVRKEYNKQHRARKK